MENIFLGGMLIAAAINQGLSILSLISVKNAQQEKDIIRWGFFALWFQGAAVFIFFLLIMLVINESVGVS